MRILNDKAADALCIRLLEGQSQCRVVHLTEDIALNFSADEIRVGIEVLGAILLFDKP